MATATAPQTGNPALSETVFDRPYDVPATAPTMTLQGTVLKSLLLIGILLVGAVFSWSQTLSVVEGQPRFQVNTDNAVIYMFAGLIGGFIAALVTIFVPRISPITAPIYAALEGLCLGALSAFFEYQYPGIVLEAFGLTVGTLVMMLLLYGTGIVKATEGFKAGVLAATGAIALVYLVDIVLMLFGLRVPFIHESGPIGIGISVVIVIVAALNLVLDFDFVAQGTSRGAPKYMEWYGGFSLLVTLVWLYLEILRLLAKIRDNGGGD